MFSTHIFFFLKRTYLFITFKDIFLSKEKIHSSVFEQSKLLIMDIILLL